MSWKHKGNAQLPTSGEIVKKGESLEKFTYIFLEGGGVFVFDFHDNIFWKSFLNGYIHGILLERTKTSAMKTKVNINDLKLYLLK